MTKTPGTPSQDLQLRFLLPDAGVRGVAVHLDETWANMVAHATYPPAAAELLGEAAAAAALFTGHAKVDGRLSVQLRADGAIRTLFAECTAAGTLRGIVRLDEAVADQGSDWFKGLTPLQQQLLGYGPDHASFWGIKQSGWIDDEIPLRAELKERGLLDRAIPYLR